MDEEEKPDNSLIKSLKDSLKAVESKLIGDHIDTGEHPQMLIIDESEGPVAAQPAEPLKGLSFTALPNVVPEDYDVEFVYGSDNERAGQAYFDRDANKLTLYIHDGFTVGELNKQLVAKYLVREHNIMPVREILPMSADPTQLRTCQYFTPSRMLLEAGPLRESDHHEFDRGFTYNSCSHPSMPPSSPCQHEQIQSECRIFLAEPWKDVKGYKSPEEYTYLLQTTRKGAGLVAYRILDINPEGDVLDTTNISLEGESLEEDKLAALKHLDARVEPIQGVVEIPLEDTNTVKIKYYDYALQT